MAGHTTREAWLTEAVTSLCTSVLAPAGVTLGEVRVSCGWPARGALSRSKRRIGECWPEEHNKDKHSHIFVSPVLDNPVEVLGTLLHELLHAALPAKVKHGPKFATLARKCGLEGKPTATTVGTALSERLHAEVLPALGAYPHQAIDASTRPKQGTRMRLYECECPKPVKVRTASDNLDACCNLCVSPFTLQIKGE